MHGPPHRPVLSSACARIRVASECQPAAGLGYDTPTASWQSSPPDVWVIPPVNQQVIPEPEFWSATGHASLHAGYRGRPCGPWWRHDPGRGGLRLLHGGHQIVGDIGPSGCDRAWHTVRSALRPLVSAAVSASNRRTRTAVVATVVVTTVATGVVTPGEPTRRCTGMRVETALERSRASL